MSNDNLKITDQTLTESGEPKKVSKTLPSKELTQHVLSTKEALDKQEKFTIRLRKDPDPKALNYETCQINGYTFYIKRGEDVVVPLAVRNILIEAGII